MMLEVIEFFYENPNPSDEDLHNWAESKGLNVNEVEAYAYALASSMVDFLHSGLAFESGLIEDDMDLDELEIGTEIEMEHTNNKLIAKRIAMDHLVEIPDYYTRLVAMESEAKR